MVEAILVHQKISLEEAREHAISLLGKVGLPEPEKVFKRVFPTPCPVVSVSA